MKEYKYFKDDLYYSIDVVIKQLQERFPMVDEKEANLMLVAFALDWQDRLNPFSLRVLLDNILEISPDSTLKYIVNNAKALTYSSLQTDEV